MKLKVAGSIALLFLATAAWAGSVTYVPGTSGVGSAINSDGAFFTLGNGTDLFGSNAYSSGTMLYASGATYSDAGVVLFFNGGLTLGDLDSVSVDATGSPLGVNLWLDTSGNGQFFQYGGMSGYQFLSLAGDSYAGCGLPTITTASSCYILGGNGAGNAFTLGQLQGGAVSGINGSTPIALWVGVTGGGGSDQSAVVNSITVNTNTPVPEPTSLLLLGTGLVGLAGKVRGKLRR